MWTEKENKSVPERGTELEYQEECFMTLGQRIQQIRTSVRLSQEAFGERLGTSRQTVSKWELDQAIPEIGKIVMISKLFSVTTDSLLVDGISTFDMPCQQFVCGVYRTNQCEIVETEKFALCFYSVQDGSVFGAKLYRGMGEKKQLCAICEYDQKKDEAGYAYEAAPSVICSNSEALSRLLGECFDREQTKTMRRTEEFFVRHEKAKLPYVGEAGIKNCLIQWIMGASFEADAAHIWLRLNTGKTEYIFDIKPRDTDIYCGISYNTPFDLGILGGRQFFRIRRYRDNTESWCQTFCNLGYENGCQTEVPVEECRLGECVRTSRGDLMWCVKRYTEEEIVLQGCGEDEYFYRRNEPMDERFTHDITF